VVVRSRDGGDELLLVRSRDGRHWVLPKGHIDPGESAEQAAAREVREEAGVEGEIVARLGVDAYTLPHEEVRALYFLMRFAGMCPPQEERALCWLAPNAARAAIEFEGSRALVDAAERVLATGRL
jgi:8-oxo-dGTP pyrophosphatase MutT (NUDIX family)